MQTEPGGEVEGQRICGFAVGLRGHRDITPCPTREPARRKTGLFHGGKLWWTRLDSGNAATIATIATAQTTATVTEPIP